MVANRATLVVRPASALSAPRSRLGGMARRLSGTVQAGLERIHLSRGRDASPGRQRQGDGPPDMRRAESLQNKRLVSVGWPKGSVKGDEARLAIGVVSYDQPRHFLLHAQDGTPLTVDLELNGKVVGSGALSAAPAVRALPDRRPPLRARPFRAGPHPPPPTPQPPSAFCRPRCPQRIPNTHGPCGDAFRHIQAP